MSDNKLVNKTYFAVLLVNGSSMLFSIACVMIDAIITGQFLGTDAVAATGLLQPVTLFCNLLGVLFGPGLCILCTRYMGMAKLDKVNQVFSLVVMAIIASSLAVAVLLFFSSSQIASALGKNADNQVVVTMISDYLRGYSFAILPTSLSAGLSGLMILDNDKNRGLLAMLATLAADVALDLLNATVFHYGMWGMAIATALSQVAGMIVVLSHFTKKDRVLRFTNKDLKIGDLKEVIFCGVPNAIAMGSSAVRIVCLNAVLLAIANEVQVAAFSASNSFFTVINSLAMGIFVATSSLVSLFYGEEDKSSIIKTLNVSMKWAIGILGVVSVVVLVGARGIAGLFLDASAVEALSQAEPFLRLNALFYLFSAISFSLCGVYQGTERTLLNSVIVALREGIFPVIASAVPGLIYGIHGFEAGMLISGVCVLIICYLIPAVRNKRFSVRSEDIIMLPKDFGPVAGETFERSIHSVGEASEAAGDVMQFCLESGASRRSAYMTSLCVEENAINILTHGYKGDNKGYIDLRIISKNDQMVIRFRDYGKPFDPLEWYRINHPEDISSGLGIRIIVGLTKDVKYVPAMGLNNLMLML